MSTVAEAVGTALARLGVTTVFGVVGSGNFIVTNALTAAGARFVPARHEGGAAVMADAYARVTDGLGVLSVHQGPGLTNAMTGITEAAKSRTPMLILAAEATTPRSNFHIDQPALAEAVGAVAERITSPSTAAADLARAYRTATSERRTVLLNLPLDVQAAPAPAPSTCPSAPRPRRPSRTPSRSRRWPTRCPRRGGPSSSRAGALAMRSKSSIFCQNGRGRSWRPQPSPAGFSAETRSIST